MSDYRDEMAYHVFGMEWEWHQAFNYQPKKPTLLDHLKDCFGWLYLKPRGHHLTKIPNPYTMQMITAFSRAQVMPKTTFFVEPTSSIFDNNEEIEIDIIRGNRG